MRRLLLALATVLALASSVHAAGQRPADMTASGAIVGTQIVWCPTGTTADLKCTFTQIATFINAQFSGDFTVTSGGVATLKNTGPGATGPLGSATVAPIVTIDAQGRVTALSSATITPAIGSVSGLAAGAATFLATPSSANLSALMTDETGTGANVFANTPTLISPTINTGMTLGFLTGSTQCVQVNTSGVVSGTVCGGTATAIPSDQTGTNYAFQGTDLTKIIYLSNASPQVPTIAQAGTGSFTNGWYTTACNIGAGTQTITPTTSTIGGAATYVLPAGSAAAPKCIGIASDGTNYRIVPDYFRFGANVETAAGLALSAAGGLTTTVASGTSALGTSAIGSAACATAVTTTATNTATTDVVLWGFNGDPTAVTGYVPLVAGMLTIIAYPSANNVNFKVCNNTSSSITPGAITLNWSVRR